MATEVEAPKEIINTDPDSFENVDVNNIAFTFTKFGMEIVKANNTKRKFTVRTPMLELSFPNVTGEGNLGAKYGGQESKNNDRSKAVFDITLRQGLAGMDDEIREIEKPIPDNQKVVAQQARLFKKVYEIGRHILGLVYDREEEEFLDKINEARKNVRKDRIQFEKGRKSGIETDEQLLAAMAKDETLRNEVTADYRDRFINDANVMFPNPATYDESGCKKVLKKGKEQVEHLQIKAKRKVWSVKPGITQKEAKNLPAYKEDITHETWPALLAEASKTHEYNMFAYFDPVGGENGQGAYLEYQKYAPDPSKPDDKIIDPFWSPFKGKQTLASCELYFNVFVTPVAGYGVIVKPYKKLTIWRQTDFAPSERASGYNMALAGGFKRKSEATSAASAHKYSKTDDEGGYEDHDEGAVDHSHEGE